MKKFMVFAYLGLLALAVAFGKDFYIDHQMRAKLDDAETQTSCLFAASVVTHQADGSGVVQTNGRSFTLPHADTLQTDGYAVLVVSEIGETNWAPVKAPAAQKLAEDFKIPLNGCKERAVPAQP